MYTAISINVRLSVRGVKPDRKGVWVEMEMAILLCTYLCAFIVSVISTHTPFRSGRVGLMPLTDNVY